MRNVVFELDIYEDGTCGSMLDLTVVKTKDTAIINDMKNCLINALYELKELEYEEMDEADIEQELTKENKNV